MSTQHVTSLASSNFHGVTVKTCRLGNWLKVTLGCFYSEALGQTLVPSFPSYDNPQVLEAVLICHKEGRSPTSGYKGIWLCPVVSLI